MLHGLAAAWPCFCMAYATGALLSLGAREVSSLSRTLAAFHKSRNRGLAIHTNFGRMGSPSGFTEVENREFSKAVNAALYVQTPLQVVLESLFSRLQNQAVAFDDMNTRV